MLLSQSDHTGPVFRVVSQMLLSQSDHAGPVFRVVSQMLLSQSDRERNAVTRPASKFDAANDSFVAEHKAAQAQLARQTDEHLDLVSEDVMRLKEMATRINVELEEQNTCVAESVAGWGVALAPKP